MNYEDLMELSEVIGVLTGQDIINLDYEGEIAWDSQAKHKQHTRKARLTAL